MLHGGVERRSNAQLCAALLWMAASQQGTHHPCHLLNVQQVQQLLQDVTQPDNATTVASSRGVTGAGNLLSEEAPAGPCATRSTDNALLLDATSP
jgi:hypothetical protein